MQKIMFNDQYGLTQAVLEGRKTQTRRIAYQEPFKYYCNCGFCMEGKDKGRLCINDRNEIVAKSKFKLGEEVAIAQRYIDLAQNDEFYRLCGIDGMPLECIGGEKGCYNKMFVKADLMPHRIRITNIRVERLQYISEEDCMKEGIFCSHIEGVHDAYSYDATNDSKRKKWWYRTPIEAYKMLSCKLHLHWGSNPLVFVYDFELIK